MERVRREYYKDDITYKDAVRSKVTQSTDKEISTFGWYNIISTLFYVGKLPLMPGTFGSIAVYPLYYWIVKSASSYNDVSCSLYVFSLIFVVLGYFSINKYQEIAGKTDHSQIVIDEAVGQMLVLAISYEWLYKVGKGTYSFFEIPPKDWAFMIGVLLFRFFDIVKPFGIKDIEKKLIGSVGVLLDDIVAALFASGVCYIIFLIFNSMS